MNERWVVDASVAIAWVHPAQATPATDRLAEQLVDGVVLSVPVIWFAEIANALLVLERRKKLTRSERTHALQQLTALPIKADHEGVTSPFGRTSELAENHGLSVYDATYLELAIREDLPLATNDPALTKAARKCEVKLLLERGPAE